jgi:hypothetical protein
VIEKKQESVMSAWLMSTSAVDLSHLSGVCGGGLLFPDGVQVVKKDKIRCSRTSHAHGSVTKARTSDFDLGTFR